MSLSQVAPGKKVTFFWDTVYWIVNMLKKFKYYLEVDYLVLSLLFEYSNTLINSDQHWSAGWWPPLRTLPPGTRRSCAPGQRAQAGTHWLMSIWLELKECNAFSLNTGLSPIAFNIISVLMHYWQARVSYELLLIGFELKENFIL